MLGRIDRRRALTDLEVNLGCGNAAGLAGLRDHLPALHGFALMDEEIRIVRVGRDPAARMTHEHEVTVALQLVAGIGDYAVLGGLDGRILRYRDIDTVVLLAVRLAAEIGNHAAFDGPAEGRCSARGGGRRFRIRDRLHARDTVGRTGLRALRLRLLRGRFGAASGRYVGCDRRARNGQFLTDLERRIFVDLVFVGDLRAADIVTAPNRGQRLLRRYRVNDIGTARGRLMRGLLGHARRDDDPAAGLHARSVGEIVFLHDSGNRNAVASGERVERLAFLQRDRHVL